MMMIKQLDWVNGKRMIKKIVLNTKNEYILNQSKTVFLLY